MEQQRLDRRRRGRVAFRVVFTGASLFLTSCGVAPVGGQCNVTSDCNSDQQRFDDAVCVDTRCVPGPKGASGVGGAGGAGGDDGGAGGGGGGDVAEVPECVTDLDCPQPVDTECGAGRCVEGSCLFDVQVGPALSQRYGDCKRRDCDWLGAVLEIEDPSDYYNDGLQCTYDFCDGGKRVNLRLSDGFPCPEAGEGYCYQGACVECINNDADMCASGLDCYSIWCVPSPGCAGVCGGLCVPCAVGYGCMTDFDCISGNCTGGMCQLPTCFDGKQNDGETGIDCGTASCGPCPDGSGCFEPDGCVSGVCMVGKCQAPTCFDATLNGDETGPDCGGSCGPCN